MCFPHAVQITSPERMKSPRGPEMRFTASSPRSQSSASTSANTLGSTTAAGGGGGVEGLGAGTEGALGLVQRFEDLGEPPHGAGKAVDAIDEKEIEAPGLGPAECPLEGRPFEGGAGELVGELPHERPVGLAG